MEPATMDSTNSLPTKTVTKWMTWLIWMEPEAGRLSSKTFWTVLLRTELKEWEFFWITCLKRIWFIFWIKKSLLSWESIAILKRWERSWTYSTSNTKSLTLKFLIRKLEKSSLKTSSKQALTINNIKTVWKTCWLKAKKPIEILLILKTRLLQWESSKTKASPKLWMNLREILKTLMVKIRRSKL